MAAPDSPTQSALDRRSALVGHIGLATACLCLGLAYLLPTQVYPRLAVLPADPQANQLQVDRAGIALIPDEKSKTGVRLARNVEVRINTFVARAPESTRDTSVVWTLGTWITVGGHGLLNARVETVSLDRRTAEPTNCCGDRLVTSTDDPQGVPLRHEGYTAWPFDVQKRSYPLWDIQLRRARTAAYLGEQTVDGIRTYIFRSDVPFTKVGTQELPGALFGRSDPSVTAEAEYADTRVFWIEPATGNVLGLHEDLYQRYRYRDRTVTAMAAQLDSPRLSEKMLHETRLGAATLPWLQGRASWILAPVGVLLLIGWALWRRSPQPSHISEPQPPDPPEPQLGTILVPDRE